MTQWTMEEKEAFNRRYDAAIERAKGRWPALLVELGVDEKVVNRRNQPCPMCGGTDRFQFSDKFGDGNYVCRRCGAGGGFKLLMGVLKLNAGQALVAIEKRLGTMSLAPPAAPSGRTAEDIARLNARIWGESLTIRCGDPVDRYFRSLELGMDTYPASLRCHPRLGYYEADANRPGRTKCVATFPALVAQIVMPDGRVAALHRTYVHEGKKAPVPEPKKQTNGNWVGGAVRLSECRSSTLALSEGLENGLAVFIRTGRDMWSALNERNLRDVWVPDQVDKLLIYGDNDALTHFAGQIAAYTRAGEFMRKSMPERPLAAQVFIPQQPGWDWKQVFAEKARRERNRSAQRPGTPPRLRAA